jgi:hypothetical protein
MKNFILDHRTRFLQGIAIYQILGGIAGFVMLYLFYWRHGGVMVLTSLLFGFPIIALYLLSIYTGYCYFRGRMTRFYVFSYVNLWVQVFHFVIPGVEFGYYYGPYAAIGISTELELLLRFKLITIYFEFALIKPGGFTLMINFVPIALLSILSLIKNAPEPDPMPGFLQD